MGNDEDVEMVDSSALESTNNQQKQLNASESLSKGDEPSEEAGADTAISTNSSEENVKEPPGIVQSTTTSIVATLKAAFEPPSQSTEKPNPRLANGNNNTGQETEIARLKEELAKEKDLRIAYEEKITSLEEEVEDLTSQVEEQDEEWRGDFERRRQQERLEMQERLHAMAEEARTQRQEAANYQKQLSEMKKSVSASTRPSTHVSDATFRDEAGVLQHEVQNWIVQNFRRVKIEAGVDDLCKKLEAVTEQRQSARLLPVYAQLEPSVRLPILQATVLCFLMDIFDEPYLFGLHGQVEWADRSRQAAEALLSVLQPVAYSRCRAVTFDALRQSGTVKELVEKSAKELSQTIIAALTAITEIEENETRLTSLTSIIKRAIDLAHLLRVQQATYDIVLPAPEDRYDDDSMDDILEEGEEDSEHVIKFATFPAIFKTTDEEGNPLESRNVIAKAKVLCSEIET